MSNTIRITGMATGLDVDSLVKQMMTAEKTKVDKLSQARQIVQWKQDMFRDIIGNLNTFKSTYFDVLKTDTYMLSSRNYSSYDITNSSTSPSVSLSASGTVVSGNYEVTVTNLAKKATITGTNSEVNIERANGSLNLPTVINDSNKTVSLNISGVDYSITLDNNNYYMQDLASQINSKLSTAVRTSDSSSVDISKQVKAVLSSDGKTVRMVGMKTFDADDTLNVKVGDSLSAITIEKGTYTFDELATKINGKLTAAGINTKVKAEVSADNNNIHFSKLDGVTDTILINDLTLPDQSSSIDDIYKLDLTTAGTSNNVLSYGKHIVAGLNDALSVKIDSNSAVNISLGDVDYSTGFADDKAILTDIAGRINAKLTEKGISADTLSARISIDGDKIEYISKSSKTINISGSLNKDIGFSSSIDLNLTATDKANTLLDSALSNGSQKVTFVINDGTKDVTFRYDFSTDTDVTTGTDPNKITVIGAKNKSIADIMNDISSKANVKMSYSQLTRKFTLESNDTGSAQKVSVKLQSPDDGTNITTSGLLTTLFGAHDTNADGYFDEMSAIGEDANVTIKSPSMSGTGINIVKPTNNFTLDGITYTLQKADSTVNNISVNSNPQKSYDKIKAFVDKYNELIDQINTKLYEKKQYDYQPLTDEQKADMKEADITKWEDKAKQGLLANDSILGNMLYAIRSAIYEPVRANYSDSESIGISMADIGITTSSDISERGKLVIDEAKLKDALQNKGDKVAQLFTKASTTVPSYSVDATMTQREQRYKESGIFQRINDILQDNLRTIRDSNGKKGILLEKAGIKGDYTEYHNFLTDDLNDKDKVIAEMKTRLVDKENKYYLQFSKLETAMQQLNSQSSWLTSQLSSMNG